MARRAVEASPSHAQVQAQAQAQQAHHSATSAPPFALFPAFTAQKRESLIIKCSSTFTGLVYTATTIDGRPMFTINRGEDVNFSYRKRVYDANGTHIFTIKRESRLFQTMYHALAPSETGPKLFECEFEPEALGDRCTGHFVNARTGRLEHFSLERNHLQKHVTITNQVTGRPVAEIKKLPVKFKAEYSVVVAPGMDMALVVALCVITRDKQANRSSF